MRPPPTRKYIPRRIAATIFDYSIVYSLTFYYTKLYGDSDGNGTYTVEGLLALVPIIFWFLFIVITESFVGGTLGHLLFRLKVLSLNNRPPSFGQVVLRRISDILEIGLCFGLIAFILVKSTPLNQRLGDLWAKTLVTGEKESFVEKKFDFEESSITKM